MFDWRSLTAFGDQPLTEVAEHYDLLVVDHPACGEAADAGALQPVDDLLDAEELAVLAAGAIGPSHQSYSYRGRQWALAVDAACQVTALAPQFDAELSTWEDVRGLARSRPGRVALPLAPAHAISSLLTLVANAGGSFADPRATTPALELLVELAALGPEAALDWEPPAALELLARGDLDCVPLTYGYVGYACRFADIPSAGHGPCGAVLGGAGLAVSAASSRAAEATAFAAWACSDEVQVRVVLAEGGQPAARAAWDAAPGGLLHETRTTIESAWVRPRDPWWPAFQLRGGELLRDALRGGEPAAETAAHLDDLYRELRRSG